MCQHLTVARVAEALAVSWDTANDAVLAEGRRVLIDDPHRFDGVKVIGVDEHVWRHTRRGDKYVTVIIDLTPMRDGTGPARLLDMVEGRSKQVFKTWLDAQTARVLARRSRGRRDGRVHRVQDRRRRRGPRRRRGDGPVPRRARWPATRWTAAADASSNRPAATAAAPATRSTASAAPCTPAPTCSPTGNANGSGHVFADRRSTSRSRRPGASTSAWSPPTATPDRAAAKTDMKKIIATISRGVPDRADRADHPRPHPEQARRRRAGLLRPARHQQRADRSDQRPPRTPPRLRPRLPQPHQLHRQIATRNRRLQTTTTPSIRMSHNDSPSTGSTLRPAAQIRSRSCAPRTGYRRHTRDPP